MLLWTFHLPATEGPSAAADGRATSASRNQSGNAFIAFGGLPGAGILSAGKYRWHTVPRSTSDVAIYSQCKICQDWLLQSLGMTTSIQKRKRLLVRNTIWDAAIALFDKRGFDQTTVDEIAKAAGIS